LPYATSDIVGGGVLSVRCGVGSVESDAQVGEQINATTPSKIAARLVQR
jgi:hypothetical protein